MQAVSPTRPSILFSIPPVEVAQAMFPSLSTATAPTVPIFPLHKDTSRKSRTKFDLLHVILVNTEGPVQTNIIYLLLLYKML